MYKNYNFDPLSFIPFATLILLANFDLFNVYVVAMCVSIKLKKFKKPYNIFKLNN